MRMRKKNYGAFEKRQRFERFTVDGKTKIAKYSVDAIDIKLAHPRKCVSEGRAWKGKLNDKLVSW